MPDAAGDGSSPHLTSASVVEIVGDATEEQVAALLSVLSAVGPGDPEAPPRRRSDWAAYDVGVRYPLRPGPGAWRTSLRSR